MPIFPYFYNNYRYPPNYNYRQPQIAKSSYQNNPHSSSEPKQDVNKKLSEHSNNDSESSDNSEYLFEIFGLKLYFDDILIICILLFLYTEEVQDEELFLCLILLLIS